MLTRLHNMLGLRTSAPIFFLSAAVIILFTVAMGIFPVEVRTFFGEAAGFLRYDAGWYFTLAASFLVIFAIGLAISRYGRLKIGDDDAVPEYSGLAWFGMLFAAGVGAVLMFWGVAEPMNHFANPPLYGTEPASDRAATEALSIANFHFGVHMWGMLIVPGLAFGYFTYKRKLPPRVSSAFQPLLGDGIHGPWGKLIDIISIVATVFGLAVSVGLGAMQINSGMSYVYGIPMAGWIQAAIIAVITAVGLASVLAGMDKGVKRLSYINIVLAIALMVFVLMFGATMNTMRGIVESAGAYIAALPALSFFNDTFGNGEWSGDWTVFYWAWTVTWAPFVGMFVARISKGRTIREFVAATIGLPTAFVIVWMGVYGYNAFRIDRAEGTAGSLTETIVEEGNAQAALFQFLQSFPAFSVVAVVALIIITVFFITSIDSGALVMDAMANGHEDEAPRRQRIFWALAVGAVCTAILTTSGEQGLDALQEVIIVIGAPVMFLSCMQCILLLQALREDAGSARPLRTRQWKRVLPAEEYHRRAQEDASAVEDFVIRPEYQLGTEPEHDTHQPRTWHWQREQEGQPVLQVGLTGGLSAGKSTVGEVFRELGAVVLDTDEIWQHVLRPGTEAHEEVVRIFGDSIQAEDGSIDLLALQDLANGNETARARLYDLVLPLVRQEARVRGREAGQHSVVVQDIRDLVATGQAPHFDLVVVVEAPAETQVDRMIEEFGISREDAWTRVDSLATDEERRQLADVVIVNDAGLDELRSQVVGVWDEHVSPVLREASGAGSTAVDHV